MALLLPILVAQTEVAWAVETGAIQGEVRDEDGLPVPNVELRLSGVELAGERVVLANADGVFRFDPLPPGTYDVVVLFHGALVARAEIRVALNTTTHAPLVAVLGAVGAEVEVVGYNPVVDTTSAAVSNELSARELEDLPVGRSYTDVLNTMAGVSGRVDTAAGGAGTEPSVRGEGQYGNNYTIDGVSTRDPVTKGSGQNLNFDAIESVQAYTDGAPAEFGQFTGMMVNVVTKDGGDEHHGTAALYYAQHAWFERTYPIFDPARGGEVPTIKERHRVPQLNATAGGPLVRERLWYFSALDLGYSWSLPEGVENPRGFNDINTYFGQGMAKLTWFPNRSWTLRYVFNTEYAVTTNVDASQFVLPEATSDDRTTTMNHRVNATFAPDERNTLELKFGFLNYNSDLIPSSGDLETPLRVDSRGVHHDNAVQFDYNTRNRVGGGFAYTRFLERLFGEHRLKVGSEYWLLLDRREIVNTGAVREAWVDQDGVRNPDDVRQGGLSFGPFDRDPTEPGYDYECLQADLSDCGTRLFAEDGGAIGNTVHAVQAYVQDDWQPMRQLTLNVGVRLDVEDGRSDTGEKPPTQAVSQFDVPLAERKIGRYGPTVMPAPRLGFALDPWANGKTKFSGHYGHYYDLAGSSLWSWANTRSASNFVNYVRDEGGAWQWSNTQDATGAPLVYAESLKPAVMAKLNLGVERELVKDLSVGVRGILSETRDIPEDVDVNGRDFYIMNIPLKRRVYRGVELTLRKQFDDVWQVWGAYTLSESVGNAPGQQEYPPGSEYASDGNNVGVYLDDVGERDTRRDFYENGRAGFLEGFHGLGRFSVTEPGFSDDAGWFGYLPSHSFHMIKLNGTWTAPFGTTFGLVYEFDSGHAWEKRTLVPFYGYEAFGQGRGSRFMPPVHYVDGGVSHEFSWAKDKSVELTLDVFNLPGFVTAITYYSNDAPGFGATLYRQAPREARLGLKYRY